MWVKYVMHDPTAGPRAPEARPHHSDGGELVFYLVHVFTWMLSHLLSVSLCPFNTHTRAYKNTHKSHRSEKDEQEHIVLGVQKIGKALKIEKSHVSQLRRVIAIIICYER